MRRRVVGAADEGKVVNAEGRVRGKAIVRLGSGGMGIWDLSYPVLGLRRFVGQYRVATWHAILLIGDLILF
jgi:hypothetical protein